MMKQVNIQCPLRMLGLILGLFLSVSAFAQIDVKGHVKDATGEPIIGATVRVDGTQTATVTDFDGRRCKHYHHLHWLPGRDGEGCSHSGNNAAG